MKYIEEVERERQGKLDIDTAEEIFERIAKEEIIVELQGKLQALEDRFNALVDNLNKGMGEMSDELNDAFNEVNSRIVALENRNINIVKNSLIGLR